MWLFKNALAFYAMSSENWLKARVIEVHKKAALHARFFSA
jgi:hypothetical protein